MKQKRKEMREKESLRQTAKKKDHIMKAIE